MSDKRSDFPCPGIISDAIRPGRSQVDGRVYDSKSALYRSYGDYEARTGKRIEIVGDDYASLTRQEAPPVDEKRIDAAISHALEKNGAL